MREIKYKILDKKNSRFVDSFSANFAFVAFSTFVGAIDPTGHSDNLKEDFDFIQYTGLKDLNGKEIYEGDILRYSYSDTYEINDENGNFLKWSEDKKEFYRDFEVIWHHGTVDVNSEYDCLYNGFAAKLVATNTPYDKLYINKIFPIANKIADESPIGFSAEGKIVDDYSIVGNIFENPELLKN